MSGMPRTALILGAGLGTRMGPLTERTPKPLLPVGGRTLLDRAIDRAKEAGAERVVVNVHTHADQMRAHLARRTDIPLSISLECDLLETGGGARNALPLIGGNSFLVLNSDAVWIAANPLAPLLEAWSRAGDTCDVLLLLLPLEQCTAHNGGGDFLLGANGAIRRAKRRPGVVVYAGAHIVRSEALAATQAGAWSFNPWWDRLIAADRIRGVAGSAQHWIDVGTQAGLAAADRLLHPD